jgi:hypothetical protein
MSEIDLFPEDLRKRLLFTRWFKLTGYAIVLLTIVFVAAFVLLREANAHIDEQIQHFQSQREISNTNRKQLEQLNQQKSDLKQQLDLLTGLRSGASAEQMMLTIDRALPGSDVWLTNWKFRRAGTPVDDAREEVNTGYFIVIAADNRNNQEETWKIPEIENVRIVSSRQSEVNRIKLVDFSLDIVVSARYGNG